MFKFTSHAITRYCERVTPGLSYRAALQNLEEMAIRATPKKMRTDSGQQQWVIDEPRCAFITKRVQDKSLKKNILLVVTVLGEDEMAKWDEENNADPYAFEKELLAEYEADLVARRQKTKDTAEAMKVEAEASKQFHAKQGYQYDPGLAVSEPKPTKVVNRPPSGWTQILAMIASEHKAELKYETHRETIRKSMDLTASALREALKTLTDMREGGSPSADACIERIKAIDPGFVKVGFIYNTKRANKRLPEGS